MRLDFTSRKCGVRVLAAVAFVTTVATGWDAEAGWRRHRRQASCCEPVCCEPVCCEPVCCEPVCCERVVYEPVCETVCDPCRTPAYASVYVSRRVESACCSRTEWGSSVVRETVIVPATTCCDSRVVATERPAEATRAVVADAAPAPAAEPRPAVARSVLTSSAR
jgi:hypothetical protein